MCKQPTQLIPSASHPTRAAKFNRIASGGWRSLCPRPPSITDKRRGTGNGLIEYSEFEPLWNQLSVNVDHDTAQRVVAEAYASVWRARRCACPDLRRWVTVTAQPQLGAGGA